MENVLILLSTYNGEKYIRQQLESLYEQRNVNIFILIRDDGSTDGTIEILQSYKKRYGNMEIICGTNIGAAKSFFELAHLANTKYNYYDYFSFCDQDDIWKTEKLERSVSFLNKEDSNKIYCGRAEFINSIGNDMGITPAVTFYDYKTSIFRNPFLGCTMVFDKVLLSLFDMAYQHLSEFKCLHDAWMFQCATFLNSKIIYDRVPTINYRVHEANVTNPNKSIINRYITAFSKIKRRKGLYRKNLSYFYKTYKDAIPSSDKLNFLKTAISYNHSIKAKIKFLKIQPFSHESNLDKALWRIMVCLNLF